MNPHIESLPTLTNEDVVKKLEEFATLLSKTDLTSDNFDKIVTVINAIRAEILSRMA